MASTSASADCAGKSRPFPPKFRREGPRGSYVLEEGWNRPDGLLPQLVLCRNWSEMFRTKVMLEQ